MRPPGHWRPVTMGDNYSYYDGDKASRQVSAACEGDLRCSDGAA